MKTFNFYTILFLGIFFLSLIKINAQDLHYSQFYNSPQNINPALTGVFNGDHRFMLSLRDQWRFVPVPWFTLSGSYDRQFYFKNSDKHFIGGGINFNHDRQGDSRLNLTSMNVAGAYHRLLTKHHIVSLGLTLGFASRGFNSQTLTWDKQWDGDVFNSTLPTGESFSSLERINFLETGLGLNYRYQKHSRTYVDLGASVLHITKPKTAFVASDDITLPRRYSISGIGNIKIINNLDIQLHALHQIQDKYNETLFGGLAKVYLSQKRGKEIQLHVGLGYRTAKSLIPTFAIQYNYIYASLSYDVDSNNFNDLLKSSKGGPEIHFRYIIANVKPLKDVKVCPIY
ncbi:MAG: PorP/SprF family type IX secretion system membrane protein [Saprospiraceae bacterium]|nr:PorP/SprF family type IX secretion system membrane protein [Saprospiraceae bacterium]